MSPDDVSPVTLTGGGRELSSVGRRLSVVELWASEKDKTKKKITSQNPSENIRLK